MSQKGDVKERVLKKVAQPGLSRPSSVRDGLIHPAFALPKRLPTTSWSRRFYLSGRANKFAPLPNKNAPRYRERRLLPNLSTNNNYKSVSCGRMETQKETRIGIKSDVFNQSIQGVIY